MTQVAGLALLLVVLQTNCVGPLLNLHTPLASGQHVDSLTPLTAVRYPTSKRLTIDYGSPSRTTGCLLSTTILGGLGGAVAGGYVGSWLFPDAVLPSLVGAVIGLGAAELLAVYLTKRLVIRTERVDSDSIGLPDIGQLVFTGFTRRAPAEVPGWPVMSVESTPVMPYYRRKPGYTLELATAQDASENSGYRYCATTVATLWDAHENALWQRLIQLRAHAGNRYLPRGGANDPYAWLREEIPAVADSIVSDLIAHLRK